MRFVVHNLSETSGIAERLVNWLKTLPSSDHAVVVGLSGELGAGKTAFVKELGLILGITEPIPSPTFILLQKFVVPPRTIPFTTIVHMDAYRIESVKELAPLGWKEVLANPNNLVLLEWPKRVKEALPAGMITLEFVHRPPDARAIAVPDEMIL